MTERIVDREREQPVTRAERRPPPLRQAQAVRIFVGHRLSLFIRNITLVIASGAKQSSLRRGSGLLRRFAPRNDDNENRSRDASWHPSFANHHVHKKDCLPHMIAKSGVRFSDKIMRTKKGGGAPIGAPSISAPLPCECRHSHV